MKTIKDVEKAVIADQELITTQVQGNTEIKNQEQYTQASEMLAQVKARTKKLELNRKEFTKDLVAQKRKIDNQFKEWSEPYKKIEDILKSAMSKYIDEQRRLKEEKERKEREKRAEEARKLAEQQKISSQKAHAKLREEKLAEELEQANKLAKKEGISQAQALKVVRGEIELPSNVKTETGQTRTRLVKKFEVVDASKVPAEYLMVDEKKIRQAVVKDGVKRIAGVKIWEESQISVY